MRRDDRGNVSDKRRFRGSGATVGGSLGLSFGFLIQLMAASETPEQFHRDQAVLFVLALVIAGYAVGWLLGPAIARLFGEA
jgi:NhaP-type Na+/H+ or K+/H+ antiporter